MKVRDLTEWQALLDAEIRTDEIVPIVEQRDGRLEVTVSSGSDASAVWAAADRIGMPEDALQVIRPVYYLMPYAGDDARNDVAFREFIEKNVKVQADGRQFLLSGLDPVIAADARVLVLGSMPGTRSLETAMYYAHQRNRFWRVVERVLGVPSVGTYDERVRGLTQAGVALWDVLRHCERVGSLDRSIEASTEVPNDIGSFLESNPTITRIVFNGRKAEQSFRRWIGDAPDGVELVAAPSTSPANAKVTADALAETWRAALT